MLIMNGHGGSQSDQQYAHFQGQTNPQSYHTPTQLQGMSALVAAVGVTQEESQPPLRYGHKRHMEVHDEFPGAEGNAVKKIKVVRNQDNNAPGIRCVKCPNLAYGFVSHADLQVHDMEVHSEPRYLSQPQIPPQVQPQYAQPQYVQQPQYAQPQVIHHHQPQHVRPQFVQPQSHWPGQQVPGQQGQPVHVMGRQGEPQRHHYAPPQVQSQPQRRQIRVVSVTPQSSLKQGPVQIMQVQQQPSNLHQRQPQHPQKQVIHVQRPAVHQQVRPRFVIKRSADQVPAQYWNGAGMPPQPRQLLQQDPRLQVQDGHLNGAWMQAGRQDNRVSAGTTGQANIHYGQVQQQVPGQQPIQAASQQPREHRVVIKEAPIQVTQQPVNIQAWLQQQMTGGQEQGLEIQQINCQINEEHPQVPRHQQQQQQTVAAVNPVSSKHGPVRIIQARQEQTNGLQQSSNLHQQQPQRQTVNTSASKHGLVRIIQATPEQTNGLRQPSNLHQLQPQHQTVNPSVSKHGPVQIKQTTQQQIHQPWQQQTNGLQQPSDLHQQKPQHQTVASLNPSSLKQGPVQIVQTTQQQPKVLQQPSNLHQQQPQHQTVNTSALKHGQVRVIQATPEQTNGLRQPSSLHQQQPQHQTVNTSASKHGPVQIIQATPGQTNGLRQPSSLHQQHAQHQTVNTSALKHGAVRIIQATPEQTNGLRQPSNLHQQQPQHQTVNPSVSKEGPVQVKQTNQQQIYQPWQQQTNGLHQQKPQHQTVAAAEPSPAKQGPTQIVQEKQQPSNLQQQQPQHQQRQVIHIQSPSQKPQLKQQLPAVLRSIRPFKHLAQDRQKGQEVVGLQDQPQQATANKEQREDDKEVGQDNLEHVISPAPLVEDFADSIKEKQGGVELHLIQNSLTKKDPGQRQLLVGLQEIFARQLPRMPMNYIKRLLFDLRHKTIALVKGGRPVGGICFRMFKKQRFTEVVFCAVTEHEQVKGYGSRLMDEVKDYNLSNRVLYLLTYADNNALGYFAKQGFSQDFNLHKSVYADYIQMYDSSVLMGCRLRPESKAGGPPAKGPLRCEDCRIQLHSAQNLVTHRKQEHEEGGSGDAKPVLYSFICLKCKGSYLSTSLWKHKNWHECEVKKKVPGQVTEDCKNSSSVEESSKEQEKGRLEATKLEEADGTKEHHQRHMQQEMEVFAQRSQDEEQDEEEEEKVDDPDLEEKLQGVAAVGEQTFVDMKVGSSDHQLGSEAVTVSANQPAEHAINVTKIVVPKLLPHRVMQQPSEADAEVEAPLAENDSVQAGAAICEDCRQCPCSCEMILP